MTIEEKLKAVYDEGYECGFDGMYENDYESPLKEAYDEGWEAGNSACATELQERWEEMCTQ